MLAGKAARGAGAPAAQAAEFGIAAGIHLASGQGTAALDAALDALPSGPIIALPLALARIAEGAQQGRAEGRLDAGHHGPLAAAYIAALPFRATLSEAGRVEMDLNTPAPRRPVARIDLAADVYARWSMLAARMLVPESDASRLSGAGAGLTDND